MGQGDGVNAFSPWEDGTTKRTKDTKLGTKKDFLTLCVALGPNAFVFPSCASWLTNLHPIALVRGHEAYVPSLRDRHAQRLLEGFELLFGEPLRAGAAGIVLMRRFPEASDGVEVIRVERLGRAALVEAPGARQAARDKGFRHASFPNAGVVRERLLEVFRFFGLAEALQGLLGRPFDLVEGGAVKNPYIVAGMNRSRELVYAA